MNNLDRYAIQTAELPSIYVGSTSFGERFEVVATTLESAVKTLAAKGVDVTTIREVPYSEATEDTQFEFTTWASDSLRTARAEGKVHYE